MIVRKNNQFLKYSNGGWDGIFHFNFQGLYNQEDEMFWGFSNLVVLNDDSTTGDFHMPMHFHANAEVLTYLIEGSLKHEDSEGNVHIMNPGDFQVMSTGNGLWHAETTINSDIHVIQMWYVPKVYDVKPSYRFIDRESYKEDGSWIVDNSMNTDLQVALLKFDGKSTFDSSNSNTYVVVIDGSLKVEGKEITKGDALALENEKISFEGNAKLLVLKMPIEPNKRFDWYRKLIEANK